MLSNPVFPRSPAERDAVAGDLSRVIGCDERTDRVFFSGVWNVQQRVNDFSLPSVPPARWDTGKRGECVCDCILAALHCLSWL